MSSEAPAPPLAAPPTPPKGIYKVGTLTYTKYGLVKLFVWLLWGDLVWTLMERVLPGVLPLKMGEMNAEGWVPFFQTTIPSILVFTLCPIISFRSDRYRSRFGRRIPYLLWTTPILSVFLMLFGLSDALGHSLYAPVTNALGVSITENSLTLVLMGLCIVGWRFGETYANTIYWYLFNDVVPRDQLAKFNSAFRFVGAGTGMLYSYFIFPKSLQYFSYIFIGAGALYLFGFMLMCLMVKEGQYPPPPENIDKRKGFISSVKTYAKECFTHKFYWYFFLMNSFIALSFVMGASYNVLRNRDSLKIDMDTLGKLDTVTQFVIFILLPLCGWLADKVNPIRVFAVLTFVMFLNPISQCVFLFKDFGPKGNTLFLLVQAIVILPFDTLMDTVTQPMYMRLLPKERYGQFASANGTMRAGVRIVLGLLAGPLMAWWIVQFGKDMAYRMFPIWTIAFQIPALVCVVLLYREWKRLGGAKAYAPPAI